MRCMRQRGQGASLSTYSKNHAPPSVARLSTKTAIAAAAAGSALARSAQFWLGSADVMLLAIREAPSRLIATICRFGAPMQGRCGMSPGDHSSHGRRMDAASARIYREGVSWHMILSGNRLPLFRIMRLSPCGGTGRRARLKIVFRKEWGFDSLHGHHLGALNRWPNDLFCFRSS